MKDEVEQIILRSILKDGLDAVPQDYEFIMKYNLKQIYFSKIEFSMHGIEIDIKSSALEKLRMQLLKMLRFLFCMTNTRRMAKLELCKNCIIMKPITKPF